jgi:hypothetical protein
VGAGGEVREGKGTRMHCVHLCVYVCICVCLCVFEYV